MLGGFALLQAQARELAAKRRSAFERHRERAWLSVERTAAEVPGNVGRALGEIGMSKRLRRSKMRNPRILQMAVLAYAYSRFVPKEKAEEPPKTTRTCR